MQLNSARQAWHDCFYTAWDSQGAFIEQLGMLGAMVQTTEKQRKASHAMHQALAGYVQQAIGTLPDSLRAFGSWMYNPIENHDEREQAEEMVFIAAYQAGPKMYAKKFEKALAFCIDTAACTKAGKAKGSTHAQLLKCFAPGCWPSTGWSFRQNSGAGNGKVLSTPVSPLAAIWIVMPWCPFRGC